RELSPEGRWCFAAIEPSRGSSSLARVVAGAAPKEQSRQRIHRGSWPLMVLGFASSYRQKSLGDFLSSHWPGLFTPYTDRAASLSGRGQWICTLRRPAYPGGEVRKRAYSQTPYMSARLYAPVPARSEAYSSRYSV